MSIVLMFSPYLARHNSTKKALIKKPGGHIDVDESGQPMRYPFQHAIDPHNAERGVTYHRRKFPKAQFFNSMEFLVVEDERGNPVNQDSWASWEYDPAKSKDAIQVIQAQDPEPATPLP